MVEWASGSILDSAADILVCPVNCRPGVMGAGLAKAFASRWPGLVDCHRKAVEYGALTPGKGHMVWITPPPEGASAGIYLLATKDDWRQPSRIEWVESGLAALVRDVAVATDPATPFRARSIAVPAIGCDLGGLPWNTVRRLILAACATLPHVSWKLHPG